MAVDQRDRSKLILAALKIITTNADSVDEVEHITEGRAGFYFEAGEFSGEIWMSTETADKTWPKPGEE